MKKVAILLLTLALTTLPVLSASAYSSTEQLDSQTSTEQLDSQTSTEQLDSQTSTEQLNSQTSTEQLDSQTSTEQLDSQTSTEQLDSQAIAERFDEINSKYKLNEKFSKEDEEFVKKYAIPTPQSQSDTVSPRSYWDGNSRFTLSGYGDVGQNSSVETVGRIDVSVGLATGSIDFSMTSRDVNRVYHSEFNNEVSITAYGVVGSDGIGITVSRTYTNPLNNANYNKYQDNDSYLANIAYYSVNAKTIVKDPGLTRSIPMTITRQ